jgi:hypothetical protein
MQLTVASAFYAKSCVQETCKNLQGGRVNNFFFTATKLNIEHLLKRPVSTTPVAEHVQVSFDEGLRFLPQKS